jgi:hypothetical protein
MIKPAVLELLQMRNAKPGEKVEFSWFWFQVCEEAGRLDVETLDFQRMASFTRDFTVVDDIHAQQMQVLAEAGVEAQRCTLMHYGRADTYYEPGDPETFMSRISGAEEDFSGWVVGVRKQGLPLNQLRGFDRMSLYELSIRDQRLLPYWLLPEGWSVVFEEGGPVVVPPGESHKYFDTDDSPARPWWKLWR